MFFGRTAQSSPPPIMPEGSPHQTNFNIIQLSNFAGLILSSDMALFINLKFCNNQQFRVCLICTLAFWVFSSLSFLFAFTSSHLLPHFALGLQSSFFLVCILDNPFSVLDSASIFYSVTHLLTLSTVGFVEYKSLIFIQSYCFSYKFWFRSSVLFF